MEPLALRPDPNNYDMLLEVDEAARERESAQLSKIGILVMALLAMVGFAPSSVELAEVHDAGRYDKHTIPTLLSVVNHETGSYLVSLDNPLYNRLKMSKFFHDKTTSGKNMIEVPSIHVDRFHIGLRNSLTLSWTVGEDHLGNVVLKDEDIIALFCGNDLVDLDPNVSRFLEAATIAQARATSKKHYPFEVNGNEQQWKIPSFPILRNDYCRFHLYQALPDTEDGRPSYKLLDSSSTIKIEESRTTPTEIHLALGNNPTEFILQFTTGEKEGGKPVASYGKKGDKDSKKASGTSHTYTASDLCEAPANETEAGKFQSPGMLHVIRLTDLEPNTEYEYKVGLEHGQGITWSDSYSFTSALVPGDVTPFSYIVYGDQGTPGNGWINGGNWTAAMTAREVLNPEKGRLPIRAVHHFGDLSYAKGAAHIWDEWLNMISSFTTRVPLIVGVGNHEYDWEFGGQNGKDPSGLVAEHSYSPEWGNFANDSGGECGVPTVNRFTMPESTDSNPPFWYSYGYGMVHTVVLSSEHDLNPGSIQFDWLHSELQSVNRTLTPWLVVELHRPLYESQEIWPDNAVGIARRMELDDTFKDYSVDLVLAGHYHSYLRTCDGLYHSRCHSGGPMHITVGSAGAELTTQGLYDNGWTEKFIMQEYGYGRITVANSSAMFFEFVKAGYDNDDSAGEVHDSVWIKRDRH